MHTRTHSHTRARTDRQRERERQRQTDKEIDRHRERQRQTERERRRQTDRKIENLAEVGPTERQTGELGDRLIARHPVAEEQQDNSVVIRPIRRIGHKQDKPM